MSSGWFTLFCGIILFLFLVVLVSIAAEAGLRDWLLMAVFFGGAAACGWGFLQVLRYREAGSPVRRRAFGERVAAFARAVDADVTEVGDGGVVKIRLARCRTALTVAYRVDATAGASAFMPGSPLGAPRRFAFRIQVPVAQELLRVRGTVAVLTSNEADRTKGKERVFIVKSKGPDREAWNAQVLQVVREAADHAPRLGGLLVFSEKRGLELDLWDRVRYTDVGQAIAQDGEQDLGTAAGAREASAFLQSLCLQWQMRRGGAP